MTTILLIRHGMNDWVGKKLVGRTAGVHLNQTGKEQAQALAEALGALPINKIYSSPLERAFETAQPLAEKMGLEIEIVEGMQEIDFGNFQGKTVKLLRRIKLWKAVVNEPESVRFPNGESFIEAQKRLVACIEWILSNHEPQDMVAVFSHADSIRLSLLHYLCMPLNALRILSVDTASVSALVMQEGNAYVPFINQIVTQDFSKRFEKPTPIQQRTAKNTKKAL